MYNYWNILIFLITLLAQKIVMCHGSFLWELSEQSELQQGMKEIK